MKGITHDRLCCLMRIICKVHYLFIFYNLTDWSVLFGYITVLYQWLQRESITETENAYNRGCFHKCEISWNKNLRNINRMEKQVWPNHLLVWPTEKVGSTSMTNGKVSLEPWARLCGKKEPSTLFHLYSSGHNKHWTWDFIVNICVKYIIKYFFIHVGIII